MSGIILSSEDRLYRGPAGIILSPEDALIVWRLLNLNPTAENSQLRQRLETYLDYHPEYAVSRTT